MHEPQRKFMAAAIELAKKAYQAGDYAIWARMDGIVSGARLTDMIDLSRHQWKL